MPDCKIAAETATVPAVLPAKAVYPLSQHIGAPAKPLVKKGDHVRVGTVLAEAGDDGLRVAKIAKHVLNACNSLFAPLGYDEVHAYVQQLYADSHMRRLLEGIRTLPISDRNFQMLGKQVSFEDYGIFFEERIAPLDVPDDLQIDAATDIPFVDPEEVGETEAEEEVIEEEVEDDFPFGF